MPKRHGVEPPRRSSATLQGPVSFARLLVFLSVVLTLIGGIHLYFWLRLVRNTGMPMPWRLWVTAGLATLALSMPLAFLLGRALPSPLRAGLAWTAFTWMGLMFLLFVLLLGTDLLRLVVHAGQAFGASAPVDPERRTLLARVLGALAGGTAGLLGGYGVAKALGSLHVRRVDVTLGKLPEALNGFSIIQLTDVHLGPMIGRSFTEKVVAMANAETPDVIAITGDLVDGSVEALREAAAPLANLKAKYGVYFITGNHEYYSGVGPWLDELTRLGLRVLRNEHVVLGDEGATLTLAGVDDASAHRFGQGHGTDVAAALHGRPSKGPVVLLAHQPKTVKEAAPLGVDLQISGHTHAGQIWPFSYLVKLDQPFVHGLHRTGDTQIYVSPGTGYWGPPMRVGTQAEITRLVLRTGEPTV